MLLAQAPEGLPTFTSGDDVAALLTPALAALTWPDGSTGLVDGDIVVVASKIIARAEGRLVATADREAAIDAESVREVVRRERPDGTVLRIVETRHGFVTAAAGVDTSNVPAGTALLLPEDPDASARRLRRGLRARLDLTLGVLVTDTVGRPWRRGAADIAIGAAGLDVLEDLRGQLDPHGRPLASTVMAVGDEIAAAAELVRGKTSGRPVAVVRGLARHVISDDGPGATVAVRPVEEDLFRRGVTAED